MKWIICFAFLARAAFAHTQGGYQEHFPKDVYEYVTQNGFIDQESLQTEREVRYEEEAAWISISLEEEENGQPYVLIDYSCEKAIDDFSGMQIGYRNGRVIGYAVFDEEGRDYVAFAPFSNEDEKNLTLFILNLIDGGCLKLKKTDSM